MQHRTVLITFPLILQTIITVQVLTIAEWEMHLIDADIEDL